LQVKISFGCFLVDNLTISQPNNKEISMIKILHILILISILFILPGCKPSGPTTTEPSQEGTPADNLQTVAEIKTKKLTGQVVNPADTEQTITYQSQVKVILPAGAVKQAGELTIAQVTSQLPPVTLDGETVGIYEIKLGEQTSFDQPITLEFAINPEKLNANLPPTQQVQAAFWDETGQQWVSVPAIVDAARQVAVVKTNHLSIWSMVLWARGYVVDPTEHFLFIYDKAAVQASTSGYTAQTSNSRTTLPAYITDLMDCLEKEYAVYSQAGYTFPESPIPVHVAAYTTPDMQTITGRIRLPYDLANINDMRHTTAHELFHIIQLQTLSTVVYSTLQWWLDATADYAADAIAWEFIKGTGLMGQDIKADWLEHDIYTTADAHAYALSLFIKYLVRSKE
jgi:hypothetical protein